MSTARFTREDGFTLTELLMAIAILGMLAAAVFWVFHVSQQTYTRAASLEDAQLGARAGLDRMAGELRLAGAFWTGATDAGNAITAASATSITFRGDLDADTVGGTTETTVTTAAAGTTTLEVSSATGFDTYSNSSLNDYAYIAEGIVREVRQLSAVAGSTITLATALKTTFSTSAIVRSVETVTYTFDSSARALTRQVGGGSADTIVDSMASFALSYYDAGGNSLGASPTLSSIREIGITLTTEGSDGSTRTMTSRVRPRNLAFQ